MQGTRLPYAPDGQTYPSDIILARLTTASFASLYPLALDAHDMQDTLQPRITLLAIHSQLLLPLKPLSSARIAVHITEVEVVAP